MAENDLVVGLAGATGALGKEILTVLDRAPWRPSEVVPLARAQSTTPFVDWGGEQLAVDDVAHADFAELDLLFCATPDEAARPIVARAIEEDVHVVDCSGSLAEDPTVPMVLPWVNPESLAEGPTVVRIPSSPAALIASALGPLSRAGLQGPVDATILLPASWWGRAGIDELSSQVVALFNAGTPPRKVFGGGLAFDLVPQVGALDDEGWTGPERRVGTEVAALTGWEADVRAQLVGVPVFSGVSAAVRIQPGRQVPRELVEQILVDGGLQRPEGEGPRTVPRPRRVEGRPFAQFGRLRVDGQGGIHLWLAADNLRMSAAVAVAAGGALARGRAAR